MAVAREIECPSARCEPGANLLGVVLPDGRIAHQRKRLPIDSRFIEIAQQGRAPEKRFRFSAPCRREACLQWQQQRCSVIDTLLVELGTPDLAAPLPRCAIRPECRWFRQVGVQACGICDEVVTDNADRFDTPDRRSADRTDIA